MKANHIKNRIPFVWERKYKFKRQCRRGIFLLEAKMRDMVEYDIRVEKEDCIYFSTILAKQKPCSNSLHRVSLISTVSTQIPLKSRLPTPIFTGNCLNILILIIFSPFFVFPDRKSVV